MKVGLTGGIGSGKSSVLKLLVTRGAVGIDADLLAREVVAPGTPGLEAVVASFGSAVLGVDGGLDRAAMAALVFADVGARQRLEGIIHPLVRARAGEIAVAAPADAIVVHDVPLLVENDLATHYDCVIVVEAPLETRVARLIARGMAEADARARIGAQASDADRRAVAWAVIDNSGDLAALDDQVDAVWLRLTQAASRPQ